MLFQSFFSDYLFSRIQRKQPNGLATTGSRTGDYCRVLTPKQARPFKRTVPRPFNTLLRHIKFCPASRPGTFSALAGNKLWRLLFISGG